MYSQRDFPLGLLTYLANPYDSPQHALGNSGFFENYTAVVNTTFDGSWDKGMKKWGGSYVQIAGPPWSIFVRPLDAEKVRLALRKLGYGFTWCRETLERCHHVLGLQLDRVEVEGGVVAYGRAYVKKLACLSQGKLFVALTEALGYDGEVRVVSVGQKAKMGMGGVQCMHLGEGGGEGGGNPWRIDVGISVSAKRALIEDGKVEDIAPDGSVIRPVAVKERGRDGISLCCTRKVYSNSGILKGGNVLVDFKGKPKSGRYFGKEKGDEILGIFGIGARDGLRLIKLKVYDQRSGHGLRTELGGARNIVVSTLMEKLRSTDAYKRFV